MSIETEEENSGNVHHFAHANTKHSIVTNRVLYLTRENCSSGMHVTISSGSCYFH